MTSQAHPEELARVIKILKQNIFDLEQMEARHRQTVAALKQSEEKFRTVFENCAVAITVADAEEKIVSWNPFTEELLGVTREDLHHKSIRSFYPAEEWQKMRSMKLRETGKIAHLDTKVIKKNGDLLDVKVSITVLKDERGNVTGSIGILRDITQRKKSEKAMQEAKEAALKLAKVKSQFLANMSHEIRTPMNGVIGMVELLEDTELIPEQREYLHTLKTSAESLLFLINDILDSSKIEAGMLNLEKIPFDLRENLMDTVSTLVLRAHTKGLDLTCQILPGVPERIIGDPGRLRQIMVNLVGNAIKFTEYGEVVVRVENRSRPGEKEVELHFSVTDTGIGIPKDKLKSIFDPFTQADSSTTRKYGGTGLGLSISHQLVKMMGGSLSAESPATLLHIHGGGMGSTLHFAIRLGVVQDERPAAINPQFVSLNDLEVLVIDDNVTNAHVLKDMISGWGMKSTVAHNGHEAMALLNQAKNAGIPFDFAVIDSFMPEMDGFELARWIMAQPEFSKIKIIMMTYIGSRGDGEKCRKLGIPAYLTKPVRQSHLLDTLMTLLAPQIAGESAPLITKYSIKENKRHLRILLAEDNLVNQQVAMRLLEKRGHNVVAADTGRKALEAVKKENFDMVLMDIQMPEMDGYEAAQAIRRRERESGAHLPIIAMTANAMEGDRQKCLEAGMDGYLSKPIRSQELFEMIDRFSPHPGKEDGGGESLGAAMQTPPAGAYLPLFDMEAGLKHVGGDEPLLRRIVQIFVEDTPKQLEKIKQALEVPDQKLLECYTHGLKGAAANVGAEAIRKTALEMEIAAQQEDFKKAGLLYPKLASEFDRTKQFFLTFQ